MKFAEKILQFIKEKVSSIIEDERWQLLKQPQYKKWFILACTAVFVVILVLSVVFSMKKPDREGISTGPQRINFRVVIPPNEIFLPDEPDFLPGVLLERGRRTRWTIEDAAEYWQDPLRKGEEQWREIIEAEIDKFLERIP